MPLPGERQIKAQVQSRLRKRAPKPLKSLFGGKKRLPFHLRPARAGEPGPPLPKSRWLEVGGRWVLATKDPKGSIMAVPRFKGHGKKPRAYRVLTEHDIRKRIRLAARHGVKDYFRKTIKWLKAGGQSGPAPAPATPGVQEMPGAAVAPVEPADVSPELVPAVPYEAPQPTPRTVLYEDQTAAGYGADVVAPLTYDPYGPTLWESYYTEPPGAAVAPSYPDVYDGGYGATDTWAGADSYAPFDDLDYLPSVDEFEGPFTLSGVASDAWEAIKGYAREAWGVTPEQIVNKFKAAVGAFLQNAHKLDTQRRMLERAIRRADENPAVSPAQRAQLVTLLGTVDSYTEDQKAIESKIMLARDKLREAGIIGGGSQLGFVVTGTMAVAAIAAAVAVTAAAYGLTRNVSSLDRQVELAAAGVLSPEEIAAIKGGGISGAIATVGRSLPLVAGLALAGVLLWRARR